MQEKKINIDKYFENEESGIWIEPEKKTVNIKSKITVEKSIDLREYSITKADYENLINAITTFRDIIKYHNGSNIRKEYILEQYNSFLTHT